MYVRRVLTMHRPDGDACGVAVWQERDGEVRLTLQGVHPTQEGLHVVVVEPGRAQDVGTWAPGEVFTASVAPGRGQGVLLKRYCPHSRKIQYIGNPTAVNIYLFSSDSPL